jgi:hypothetical protein
MSLATALRTLSMIPVALVYGISNLCIPTTLVRPNAPSSRHRAARHFGLVYLSVVCVVALYHVPSQADTVPAPTILEVSVRDGLLSVRSEGTALDEVLRVIGQQAGIDYFLTGELGSPVNRSLVGLPLDEGLRELIGDQTALVIFYTPGDADEATKRVTEIWVYGGAKPQRTHSQVIVKRSPEAAASVREDGVDEQGKAWSLDSISALDRADRVHEITRLAALGDNQSITALGQILSADEHPTVREQAVKALSELEGEPVVAALQNGLGDEEPWIRSEVVGALGNIGGEQAVISLGQVLFGEPEPEIRSLAIDYLATQPGEAARHFLEAALEDPDVLVRQAAESALIGSQ